MILQYKFYLRTSNYYSISNYCSSNPLSIPNYYYFLVFIIISIIIQIIISNYYYYLVFQIIVVAIQIIIVATHLD